MLTKEELRTLIEIIEERVFDGHCSAINDLLYPENEGTGIYTFNWDQYISIVNHGNGDALVETPSYHVPEHYFELYNRLREELAHE